MWLAEFLFNNDEREFEKTCYQRAHVIRLCRVCVNVCPLTDVNSNEIYIYMQYTQVLSMIVCDKIYKTLFEDRKIKHNQNNPRNVITCYENENYKRNSFVGVIKQSARQGNIVC